MKETELTVEIFDDVNKVKEIFENKGFELIKTTDLNDFYFSKHTTAELQKMNYSDLIANSFIVRQTTIDHPNRTINEIIYKNKELDENNNVIAEEKTKCQVDDFENLLEIFHLANLNCWCNLYQHTLIYKKDDTELALQIVNNLSVFIEYEENETMKKMNTKEKISHMMKNLNDLGLKMGQDFSCKKVFLKFQKDNILNQ